MSQTDEQVAPYHRAAFINALAEEGTRAELIEWLQKTWNELCEARLALQQARAEAVVAFLHGEAERMREYTRGPMLREEREEMQLLSQWCDKRADVLAEEGM